MGASVGPDLTGSKFSVDLRHVAGKVVCLQFGVV
jgi:hypothetical protein